MRRVISMGLGVVLVETSGLARTCGFNISDTAGSVSIRIAGARFARFAGDRREAVYSSGSAAAAAGARIVDALFNIVRIPM